MTTPAVDAIVVSPKRLATIALAYRRLLIGLPVAAVAILAAVTLIQARTHTATAAFAPASGQSMTSALAGVAAEFGIAIPTDQTQMSPLFYADLVMTDGFLRRLAQQRYRFTANGVPMDASYIDINEIEEGTPAKTLYTAVRMLREDALKVTPNRLTGVVSVSATTEWPELSTQIVREMLAQVDEFNLQSRMSQAAAERTFLERRLDSTRAEMRRAENELQEFLQRNRDFRNDPRLQFEYDRMQREITLRQTVYATITQAYEQARVEAVRNTPSLTIVEPPTPPLRPDRRRLVIKALLTGVLALIMAVAVAAVRESWLGRPLFGGSDDRALAEQMEAMRADIASLRRLATSWMPRSRNG